MRSKMQNPNGYKTKFGSAGSDSGSPAGAAAASAGATSPGGSPRSTGSSPSRSRGSSRKPGDAIRQVQPSPSTPQVKDVGARIAPAVGHPGASSRSNSATRGSRAPLQSSSGDTFDMSMDLIRANAKKGKNGSKGMPYVKILLLMNNFNKRTTGSTSKSCDSLLNNVLENLADGNAIDAVDTTSHLDNLAGKLENAGVNDANGVMTSLRGALAAEIKRLTRENPAFILPYVLVGEVYYKGRNTKDSYTAEQIADEIAGNVKEQVKRFVEISHTARNMEAIIAGLDAGARNSKLTPHEKAFVSFIRANADMQLTQDSASLFLTALMKGKVESLKIPKVDKDGNPILNRLTGLQETRVENSYIVPRNEPYMNGAENFNWQPKDGAKSVGHFMPVGPNYRIPIFDRGHLLEFLFPKIEGQKQNADIKVMIPTLLGKHLGAVAEKKPTA